MNLVINSLLWLKCYIRTHIKIFANMIILFGMLWLLAALIFIHYYKSVYKQLSLQGSFQRNHLLMPLLSVAILSMCFHNIFFIPWSQYFSIFDCNSLSLPNWIVIPLHIPTSTCLAECLAHNRNSHTHILQKPRNYRLTSIYKYFTFVSFHLWSSNSFTHWKHIIVISVLYSTTIYNNNS